MTLPENRDVVILIHLNRSGSTFLANQVSAHPQICVCPEAHLALQRLLGGKYRRQSIAQKIKRLLADVSGDQKLASWGLNPDLVAARVRGAADDVEAFHGLLNAYADTICPQATAVMVKGYFFIDLIQRRRFAGLARGREAKAILLMRDPRAIFNSQKRSISSTLHRPMQESAIACALRWRIYMRHVSQLAADPRCLLVQYEQWTADNDAQLARLFAFLGLAPQAAGAAAARLATAIPSNQRHLHQNIAKGPLVERNLAWKQSLPNDQIALVQSFCGRNLREHYEILPVGRAPFVSAAADVARWAAGRLSLLR